MHSTGLMRDRLRWVGVSRRRLTCAIQRTAVQQTATTQQSSPVFHRWHSTVRSPHAGDSRFCRAYNVSSSLVRYETAWVWQQRLFRERFDWQRQEPRPPGHDVLLLVEHNDVYTLGRKSTLDNFKFDPLDLFSEHEVRRTERGGEVTWHGPGQVVVYPIVDLNYHKKDLHWYLRQLEEVIIRVLARHGLEGEREKEHTGVWVGGAKVAAIGLNASSWITSHGFSLNVFPDLEPFDEIIPCGIKGRPVTRMCDLLPLEKQFVESGGLMQRIRADVVEVFGHVFNVDMDVKEVDNVLEGKAMEVKIFPVQRDRELIEKWELASTDQLFLERLQ